MTFEDKLRAAGAGKPWTGLDAIDEAMPMPEVVKPRATAVSEEIQICGALTDHAEVPGRGFCACNHAMYRQKG